MIKVLYSRKYIKRRVKELATQINTDYRMSNRPLVLVPVLTGAVMFLADLSRRLTVPHQIQPITAKSYIGKKSSGTVILSNDSNLNLKGKDVIIVEDIIDTGRTLTKVLDKIQIEEHPASVECCVLLDKKCKREFDVPVKYIGFTIDDHFVIGYGLDYNEGYRYLPYIGVVTTESRSQQLCHRIGCRICNTRYDPEDEISSE